MRPPECDVCGEPAGRDGLIDCLPTEAGAAFLERAQSQDDDRQPGIVGHPPDTGWFCSTHAPQARELAPTHRRGDIIGRLRTADLPPTSEPKLETPPTQDFPRAGSLHDLHRTLSETLPVVLEHAGIGGAQTKQRADRDWRPMDGSRPPDCSYVDIAVLEARVGEVWVYLESEEVFWNANDAARAVRRRRDAHDR